MPTQQTAISSVVTMGEPALKETVSASNGKSSVIHRFDSPMVIRGGIIGDAFVRAAPAVAAPTATPADTAGAPAPQPEPDATTTSSYGQPATEQPATELPAGQPVPPAASNVLPRDLGEIRDLPGCRADAREQRQTIAPDILILIIHENTFEE